MIKVYVCAFLLPEFETVLSETMSRVSEGHHPRGTTLREPLQGKLPLRGFLGASAGVSSRVLWGSAGFRRGSRDFRRAVTLCL